MTGAPAPPLAVYDATGGAVQQGLAWHHASALTFTPPTAGLYHVAVGGPAAEPGRYTLTVDEPPSAGPRRTRTLAGATLKAAPAPQRSTALPAKPRGLSATASHDQVVLTWDDPGDASITGYVILRRVRENDTGGKFRVLVADTGSAATTYTDATVSANTTYTYRIKAINAHGVSPRSRWFHIDTPAAPEPEGQAAEPPAKPTGLSATATHNTVVLTWNDPGDASITGYVILRRVRENDVGGEFSELVPDTGTAATTYTDDTVQAATTYTYRIKAINAHGVSERSRWFHIDTPAAPEAVEGDDQDGQDGGGAPGHATPPGPGGRANVSEGNTDLPANTSTTGEIDVGGSVTGTHGTQTDRDWFRVELEAGTRYQFDVEGADTGRGTTPDPAVYVYDATGTSVMMNDDNSGVGKNARSIYTPTTGGTYYVASSDIEGFVGGTYTLSVIVLGANGASEADTDFPATTATTGRVEVGASVTGNIASTSDKDWFRVDLEAGKTYQFDLEGADSGRGTLVDPFLSLYDGSATFLLVDDDSGTNLNSQMVYKAASAGAHYLRATTGAANLTGTYTLSVRDITPMLSTDATLSGLSLGTGVTLSPAFASGTVTYTASVANSVDEVTVTPTTNHARATVEILDTDDNALDDADDMEDDFQVALSVGDTVIKVKVTAEDDTSTQTYTVTVTRDDFPNDNTTTGEVEVGGTVTGNIGTVGDYDRFKVELEADTRYQFDVEGADTGRGTLSDPDAIFYDASAVRLVADNDSGVGKNGRVIYTPTADGTYYIAVSGAVNTTGTYTLSVIVLGANGVSEADTDFPADNTTSGRVEVGASATGNIASTSDKDWFRVDLEAGKVYQIDLEGWPTGRGSLLDPYLRLLDGSGNLIENNDDIGTANLNSQLVFTPTAAGTYYLVVETAATTTGTYTLSVREIACTLNTGDIWCGVVTVAEVKSNADMLVGHGFADGAGLSAGSLAGYPDETVFSVGDNDYTISAAYIQVPTGTTLTGTLYVLLSADLTDDDKAGLVLTVDDTTTPFEFSGATKGSTGLYSWGLSGLTWSAGDTVTIRVRPRTLSVADASDAENDGEVDFTVTLSEAAATAVTATWTASIETGDTAVAADLGSTKTGTVTVAIGDTTGTFEVPVVNDAADEGDETFTVTLSSPSSNAKLETDPTATGTIEDDDATALSMDATLSGLSLGTGVTLSPAFASGTVTYTASVANSVDEVTVTPTTNHARATVEILDTDDNALDDADDMEDDFQVALSVGDTVIKVKVTAEDDTSTQTYTVTVTRAAEMTPDDPPDDSGNVPEPVTDLLSNLGQANNVNFAIAVGDFENAQGFTTGSDSYGYFLASISLDVNAVPKTPADVTVSLWSATSDSPPKPDASVATLTHSTGTWATGVNTFNAPGGTVLDPGTTYFVVQSYSGARAHLSLRVTASGSADDDSTGWSVAGARLTRSRTDLGDWSGQSGEYTKFSVSGAAVPAQGVAEGATDLPADTSTGGVVEVDGFGARGAIHPPIGTSIDIGTLNDPEISTTYVFDTDWFAVELEAGRTYRIDMKGRILSSPALDTPGVPVDPELTLSLPQINAIYDADGDYLFNTWARDESSAHHLFRVTFHAHAGGTYYIAASGESFEWGGYELTVIDITEDP